MAPILLYTTQYCGYCRAAKRLLSGKQVTFEEIDVGFDPELRAEMVQKAGGRLTVPQIFIHGRHVGGFEELAALDRDGKLDEWLAARPACGGRRAMTAPGNRQFRAALVQLRSGRTVEPNLAKAETLIRRAAAGGAIYVQTPENTALMELAPELVLEAARSEERSAPLEKLRALAAELEIWLHAGSLAIRLDEARVANRSYLLAPDGSIAARYDKLHMFDVDLAGGESYRESQYYRPGGKAIVVDLPFGRLGMSICYDLRFPSLYRALAGAGAEFIAVPSAFTRQTGEAHWRVLARARAIETGSYVLAATQGGLHENGRSTFGHSMIVSPWGEILAEAGEDPGVVLADIDLAKVEEARHRIPALRHGRSFDVELVKP
jgi:GrxC family glutaredoxin